MIWKKFTFVAKVFVIWLVLMSCSWGPWDGDYRVQLFDASVGVSKNMYPFYYSYYTLNSNFEAANMTEYFIPQENLDEWRTVVTGNYSDEDIVSLVYSVPLDSLYLMKNNKQSYGNDFAKSIINNNQSDVLDYLIFARKVENALPDYYDYWDDTDEETDWKLLEKYATFAKKFALHYNHKNISQRYAYQAIVIYRYMSEYKKAVNLYNKTFAKIEKADESVLKYWALSHVAFCEENLQEGDVVALNYLDVFYNCDAKKHWSYRQLKISDLEQLQSKFTDQQNYTFLVLKELHNPGKALTGLKEIAKIDPNHELYRLLINREVNKIEHWLLTKEYIDYKGNLIDDSNNLQNDTKYTKDIIDLVKSTLNVLNNENKAHAELVLAHLFYLLDDYNTASGYLKNAKPIVKTEEEIKQFYTEKILINSAKTDVFSDEFAETLFNDFKHLDYDNKKVITNSKVFQSLIQAEYRIFHDKKQYDIAALFMAFATKSDFSFWQTWWNFSDAFFYLDKYASIEQVESFMNIVEKNNKNSMESYLLNNFEFDKNRYYDLLGTMELRKNNLESAYEYYKKIPANFWQNKYYYAEYLDFNPFDNSFLYWGQDEQIDAKYADKRYFVEKLLEIRKQYGSSVGEEKGKYALQLANAYYNMSYYGKNWMYVCYGKSADGGRVNWTAFNVEVNKNYQDCSEAFKYYDEAIALLTDVELKSKAYFFATGAYTEARSWNLRIYEGDYYSENYWKGNYSDGRNKNPYVAKFKAFSPEKFEQYLDGCGY
ncbi:MAG: hypothetical protein JXL97_02530 [Bacteroidales bacterium]|nr:hypothetical protein [Bacteroidales bacterium]